MKTSFGARADGDGGRDNPVLGRESAGHEGAVQPSRLVSAGVDVEDSDVAIGGFRHVALLYAGHAEYLTAAQEFVQAGLDRTEPVFVAVPLPPAQLGLQLDGDSSLVTFADMTQLGLNPARLIPAVREFVDSNPGQRVRYLGEPIWPGRTEAERQEAARHEALLNLAFADAQATILCPYGVAELPPSAISGARRTHPTVISKGTELTSQSYRAGGYPPGTDGPLPEPPAGAQTISYTDNLRPVRRLVAAAAQQAGLSADRTTDLVISASEIVANTLRHTCGSGTVRLWQTAGEVLCQVEDDGFIDDPLAGRRKPARDQPGGQGLWLVNQICDLMEIRTSPAGTTIRLHMHLGG